MIRPEIIIMLKFCAKSLLVMLFTFAQIVLVYECSIRVFCDFYSIMPITYVPEYFMEV